MQYANMNSWPQLLGKSSEEPFIWDEDLVQAFKNAEPLLESMVGEYFGP